MGDLTYDEAARLLGVSRSAVRVLLHRGDLAGRGGRNGRVTIDSVRAYLAQRDMRAAGSDEDEPCTARFTFSLPRTLLEAAHAAARRNGVTTAAFMRAAIRRALMGGRQ